MRYNKIRLLDNIIWKGANSMKYQIIGKNIVVTEGIENAITKKLSRMNKYFRIDDKATCRAVVSSQKVGAKVEITIFLPSMILRAEVEHADLYAAVDLAIDKLEGQMRKLKTRMDRGNSKKFSFAQSIVFKEIEDEAEEEKKDDKVVRAKSYYLTPMTIDEAIARMEALGHSFFLYLDEEDEHISVVYVRNDGGYGVIQAENEIK